MKYISTLHQSEFYDKSLKSRRIPTFFPETLSKSTGTNSRRRANFNQKKQKITIIMKFNERNTSSTSCFANNNDARYCNIFVSVNIFTDKELLQTERNIYVCKEINTFFNTRNFKLNFQKQRTAVASVSNAITSVKHLEGAECLLEVKRCCIFMTSIYCFPYFYLIKQ